MAGRLSTTKLTFSVTLTMPKGLNIPLMREYIREAIKEHQNAQKENPPYAGDITGDIKVHLTNKEVTYGKR